MKKGKITSMDLINTALQELPHQGNNCLAKVKHTKPATISQEPGNKLVVNDDGIGRNAKFIVPLQDRILVSRSKPESVTAGGIIIPEMAVKSNNEGYVQAVGPLVGTKAAEALRNDQADFCAYPKIGDRVLFGEYAGTEIEHGGKEYLLMRENDIMAILPE